MTKLLNKRTKLSQPIYICDALSRNLLSSDKTTLCHCLAHAYRKFDDLKAFYPNACNHVIECLSAVYKHDDKTRTMSPVKRLAHHQAYSKPLMQEVKTYILSLINDNIVEPNSPLGKVINYTLKHWHPLTQFLRSENAPLDNNIVERALKVPIRSRKTGLFYKTQYGAMIGGILTSVIHTCALAKENPIAYLIALQENKDRVVKEPHCWLPWNYQQQLLPQQQAAA